jgi:hypothetical protein
MQIIVNIVSVLFWSLFHFPVNAVKIINTYMFQKQKKIINIRNNPARLQVC